MTDDNNHEADLTITAQVSQKVLDLYEKALHHCRNCIESMGNEDLHVRNRHFIPLSTIVSELFSELKQYTNQQTKEELSRILSSIYSSISKAMIHNDTELVKTVLEFLEKIRLTYQEDIDQNANIQIQLKSDPSDNDQDN